MVRIQNGKIGFESPTGFVILKALEIFDCIYSEDNVCNQSLRLLKSELNSLGINFSQYPIDCKIVFDYESTSKSVYVKCIAYKLQKFEVEIEFYAENPADYILFENTWYPLKKHLVDTIVNKLTNVGISSTGLVSFEQYIRLNQFLIDSNVFHTKIRPDDIKKAISEDDSSITPKSLSQDVKLRQYQQEGFAWLDFMSKHGIGCLLADEMGLGKTLQIIALLCAHCNRSELNHLIIAPTSLLENWRRELLKFAPLLSTRVHKGRERACLASELKKYNVVITSYDTAVIDISFIKRVNWGLVVLDEAHYIKNPQAQRTLTIKNLPRKSGIAVTGTPLSNRIRDLWSLIDFVSPSYLGTIEDFQARFLENQASAAQLEPIVSPIILRRTVEMVGNFLPPLVEIPQCIEMDEKSSTEYDVIRRQGGSGSFTFSTMQPLRQFCTHPWVAGKMTYSNDICQFSNKTQRLYDILEEIFESNQKVLIFTSFHKSIDILLKHISLKFSVHADFIDGRVADSSTRQSKIDNFQKQKSSGVLLLNPESAGVGLNITAANHVIHFNPVWNPAIEDQATARAFRMGQTKTVFVHRLFYKNTVEQIMDDRMQRKRKLFDTAIIGTDGKNARESLLSIFSDAEEADDLKRAMVISPLTAP